MNRLSRRHFMMGSMVCACFDSESVRAKEVYNLPQADQLLRKAVDAHKIPGAVLAVGFNGKCVHRYVYGCRALVPDAEPMTWDTVFDMASLTKPTMTALAVMQLVETGQLELDKPVSKYFPDFAVNGKEAITLWLLMTHYSGLPPDLPLNYDWSGKEIAVSLAMQSGVINAPGTKFVYSDINYIVLGLLVEKVSGQPLNVYVKEHILSPLGMVHSGYLPERDEQSIIAPTQYDDHGVMLRGIVHDPTARRMGGVAGHAGLFSNAGDMCLYVQALLDRLAGRASRFPLKRETLQLMVTPQQPPGKKDLRGLGWDIATHYSTPRGDLFSDKSFGHTGFTGPSVWIDPVDERYVLILTNRVHPSGGQSIVKLRYEVASAVARGL
ncbi:serine hydrolase domain-containing protein [Swingsia samuiensis]|uniref:Class A beta-lactamase-related serine hydrolase n=1 Tax=Swingsia samuiensis TaxID=1293412 RepID=A0A4Y6UN07_9PROT|nr:serine hydrolase domain-containing protein [Swingsia samuiensis]QDH17737.1 class A beta-lactamase-related serine hydrolase [Swingsia samuiensis]